jgi:hypothetical protein
MTETANAPAKLDYELIGTVYTGGKLHAIYPTGLRTLCLREERTHGELMKLRPTCLECMRVVNAWRNVRPRIEGLGIPTGWFPERTKNGS